MDFPRELADLSLCWLGAIEGAVAHFYGTELRLLISESAETRDRLPAPGACVRRPQAFYAPTAPADRRGRTIALVIGHADQQAFCGRGSDPRVARNQSSGDGARGRRAVPWKAPSLTVPGPRNITGNRWSGPLFFGLKAPIGENHDGTR